VCVVHFSRMHLIKLPAYKIQFCFKICCTDCKPQLFSIDNNAMVSLHFMLMIHTYPFAIQVKLVFFYGGLKPSNISSRFFSLCVHHVSLYYLDQNVLIENIIHILKVLSCLVQLWQTTCIWTWHSCSSCIQHMYWTQFIYMLTYCWGWGNNVTMPTVLQTGWTRVWILVRAGDFPFSNYIQMKCEPPFNLCANGCRDSFLGVQLLTCHLHPVLRLRMRGAIPVLPPVPPWHALLGNFTVV
jgi:hypothetical protein